MVECIRYKDRPVASPCLGLPFLLVNLIRSNVNNPFFQINIFLGEPQEFFTAQARKYEHCHHALDFGEASPGYPTAL